MWVLLLFSAAQPVEVELDSIKTLYLQAVELTEAEDIGALETIIERMRDLNDTSTYLIDPVYNLAVLYIEAEDYVVAKETLLELINWPDSNAVRGWMPEIVYQLGNLHYKIGEFEEAFNNLEYWTENYTLGELFRPYLAPQVYLLKGQAAEELKWWGDALSAYRELTDKYPYHPLAGEVWVKLVDFYLSAREADKAVAAVDELKSLKAKNPKIYKEPYNKALALMYDYMEKIAQVDTTCEMYPGTIIVPPSSTEKIEILYYHKAVELAARGDVDELFNTVERIRDYNDRSPYLVEPAYNLAFLLTNLERYEEAIDYWTLLKGWHDQDTVKAFMPFIIFYLGKSYYQIEHYYKGATELEAGLPVLEESEDQRIRELYVEALKLLYEYYLNISQNEEKAEYYAKKIISETGSTDAIEMLYYSREVESTELDGDEELRKAIESQKPKNPDPSPYLVEPNYNLALLLMEADRYQEAIDVLNTLKNWPDTAAVKEYMSGIRFNLGKAFLMNGDYEAAFVELDVWSSFHAQADSVRLNQAQEMMSQAMDSISASTGAMDIYRKIVEAYPERPAAGIAYQKIVELYLDNDKLDSAEALCKELKERKAKNPRIYKEPYTFALALLYDYYLNVVGDTVKAEEYAKILISETGHTEKIDWSDPVYPNIWEIADIDSLQNSIKRVEEINFQSPYLIEPNFNLALLLMQEDRYQEAIKVLNYLKDWPDKAEVRDMMPEIEFQLCRAHYEMGKYSESAQEFETWVKKYSTGEEERMDLAPNAYWILALAYVQQGINEQDSDKRIERYRKGKENLEILKNEYRDTEAYAKLSRDIDSLLEEIAEFEKQMGDR
ncbi:tetratricopeptide repeat protein [candidate division WOR-3 bacterium]|nr:tetratricopeptide repeat protein [candidate division WOR-3 bacterium]